MASRQTLTDKHSFLSEALFHFKSSLLITKRLFSNTLTFQRKHYQNDNLINQSVISFSESELWNPFDTPDNWILTAGKAENLRIAVRKINGIELDANQVFSFWKYIGNPNRLKGYVLGREIREGCIVPTIAGGLCQLSNALYDAALKAGFTIIERHKHTRVIKGSLAEQDRDATVKWNYIDLRFKANGPFRIEAELTADRLVVKFKTIAPSDVGKENISETILKPSQLNDCYSCGNSDCFKHPKPAKARIGRSFTTYILDEKWDEYDRYINEQTSDSDFFILPAYKSRFINTSRYAWTIKNLEKLKTLPYVAISRTIRLRFRGEKNIFKVMLATDKLFAKTAAKHIPIESTHIVVSQNLLPFLWETGALGGRTFDVMMNRLPFELLHRSLDVAYDKYSESPTLNDFRADAHLIENENHALTNSRSIITPHTEIANIFNNKSVTLNWVIPQMAPSLSIGNKILFPASALGRKGVYEIRRLAKELNLEIVILGNATEDTDFWNGVKVEQTKGDVFTDIGLVVYPAYIEHQPRVILKALAAGIPVITTKACGLPVSKGLTIIPTGNYDALNEAVISHLKKGAKTVKSHQNL
jgi:hypothetical protein